MSNFQSYSSYVPQEEEIYSTGPQIRQDTQVHRVSLSAGVVTETSTEGYDKGSEGQINPHHGTDTWQATATTKAGRPVSQITADSLVTINGIQGTVSFFVSEGMLQQGTDGKYTEGSGPTEAPQAVQGDHSPVPNEMMDVVNAALEPLPQHALDLVTAQGIGVALGKLDDASLARKFSEQSGLDLVDSGQRVHAIKAVYQAQADSAIESRSGITPGEAQDFWTWARANHGGQLQDAIGKQLRGHDVSGYKALADRWMSETPPSMAALKAAGIPTRTQSKGPECYINGIWMSPSGAAKAGLI